MSRTLLIAITTIAHVVLAIALGAIEVEPTQAASFIEMVDAPEPVEPEPPKEPDPPEPVEQPSKAPEPKRAQRAEPPPAQAAPPETNPLDALPDFGLDLSGPAVGGGGVAVRQGTGPLDAKPVVRKTLAPVRQVEAPVDRCKEPAGKPSLLDLPRPTYTDAARQLGIEGKVRVRITVDERGNVVAADVIQGLGHGLDDAAVAAARAARFEPGLRCGKAVKSTFTVSIRFSTS